MSKTTTYFAQYRTDHIARCIAERKPFTTYGNLSGRPVDDDWEITPQAWESQHPAWSARLAEIKSDPYLIPVYVVRSFRTIIAVLVRSHHAADLDEHEMPKHYWEFDAAARSHSNYTSRAVMSFEQAIGRWSSWHSDRLGNMTTLYPEQVFSVREIGRDWLVAQRLSPTQRRFLWSDRGLPIPAPTRKVLLRERLLDERGFLTDFGLNVAQWCA